MELESLFVHLEADEGYSQKIESVLNSELVYPITTRVMELRDSLRALELAEAIGSKKVEKAYAKYWKELVNLYRIDVTLLKLFETIFNSSEEPRNMAIRDILEYIRRTKSLFELSNGVYYVNDYPDLEHDFKITFYSDWPLIMVNLEKDPEEIFENIVEIETKTEIEEEDWHGLKKMKGVYIVRRNAECGTQVRKGVVFVYLYVENHADPDDSEKAAARTMKFYAIPERKDEIRRYQLTISAGV